MVRRGIADIHQSVCHIGRPTPCVHSQPTTTLNSNSALLLFAHGSSDPGWALPFERLRDKLAAKSPERRICLAYLERMQPSFDDAVTQLATEGVREVVVAPVFLALGGHLKSDLPALVQAAAARTAVHFTVLPPLGEVDSVLEATADWLASVSDRH